MTESTENNDCCACEHCRCGCNEVHVVHTTIESADLMRTIGSAFDRYQRNARRS